MTSADTVQTTRRWFSESLGGKPSVSEAFAHVARERFLVGPPWHRLIPGLVDENERWEQLEGDDLAPVYANSLFALDIDGQTVDHPQPSDLARWLSEALPEPGQTVLHVGCGAGYCTALLSEMVGPTGRVFAYEPVPELAARARGALADVPQVTFVDTPTPDAALDVVFVTVGITHPMSHWLTALKIGGRMVLPLTTTFHGNWRDGGFVVRIERHEPHGARPWLARVIDRTAVRSSPIGREPRVERQLEKLLREGCAERIRWASTLQHEHGDEWCVVHLDGFCLQIDP